MALGLPERGGGEDRTPIIKYDARAGRVFRVDRTQSDGSWDTNTVEITPVFQAVMDLEHIELGWLYFPTNGAPDIQVAPFGKPLPEKPSSNHRPGFRVHMKLGKQAGGDLREMAANAKVSIDGMDALHDAFLKDRAAHPGQMPVVKLDGTTAVSSSGKDASGKQVSSTNYRPDWGIVGWIDPPPELKPNGAGKPAGAAAQQQQLPDPEPVKHAAISDDF
jgi:hypothetical protein